MEHEIDDARRVLAAEQPAIEPRHLVADARQVGDRRKQGVENTGTHGGSVLHRTDRGNGRVVIATVNLQPVLAAQAAIKSTPIVFAIGGDPVEIGLVINLKTAKTLERDDFSLNRHPALSFCWSMIFSENR
jgi:hypothetical protein